MAFASAALSPATSKSITQTAHGFTVGQWVYLNGSVFALTDADLPASSDSIGVVSAVGSANTFTLTSGGFTSGLAGLVAGNRYYLSTTAGTLTTVAPSANAKAVFIADSTTSGFVQQFAVGASSQALTYGRVNASTDLASTVYTSASNGVKIPFDNVKYASGVNFTGTDVMTPTVSGRYQVSWLMQAGSGEFAGNGYFVVMQNGVFKDRVLYDMMEAAGVNQCAGFIDVDLTAGLPVELRYQTVGASDTVIWQAGSYFQLTQLPTAVAPVVSTVAEYGENNGIVSQTVGTGATYVDVTGSEFTLPSAGVWEVNYVVEGRGNANGAVAQVIVTDASGVDVGNSQSQYNAPGLSSVQMTLTQTVRITTTGASAYKLQIRTTGASFTTQNSTAASGVLGGISKVTWAKIAGQLPSTGTTVDYVTSQGTNNTYATGGALETNTLSGNIPNTLGVYTLSAGKTYRLQGSVRINQTTSSVFYQWRDITNNVLLGVGGMNNANNNGATTSDQQIAEAVVTPSATITVRLENTSGGVRTIDASRSWATIQQLGSSNVIVTDNVAQFGEQQLTPTTFQAATDITGGSFTLPSAGVWDVEYFGFISVTTGNAAGRLFLTDAANVEVPNSSASVGTVPAPAGNTGGSVSQKVRITTTGPTTYKLRGSGNTTVSLQNGVGVTASSKITWTKIAGQLPSTGQTVDYVNVYRSTGYTVANSAPILFDQTITGNIPYNSATGRFTLTAGKTYRLTGNVAISETSTQLMTAWATTSGVFLSPTGQNPSANNGGILGTNQAEVIYTPTVTEEVELRNISGGTRTIAGNTIATGAAASAATIVQLGSTSNTVGTLPAQDQSSAGYFTVGNLKYMWGTGTTNGVSNVTLPTAFTTTNYRVITSFAGGGAVVVNPTGTKTTTTFQVNSFFAPDGGPSGFVTFDYIAIGQ